MINPKTLKVISDISHAKKQGFKILKICMKSAGTPNGNNTIKFMNKLSNFLEKDIILDNNPTLNSNGDITLIFNATNVSAQ